MAQPSGVGGATQQEEEWMRQRLDAGSEEAFAGSTGTYADSALIDSDLQQLAASALEIRGYVDQHLAHTDEKRPEVLPTYETLNAANRSARGNVQ
jgi:hypothetical protein